MSLDVFTEILISLIRNIIFNTIHFLFSVLRSVFSYGGYHNRRIVVRYRNRPVGLFCHQPDLLLRVFSAIYYNMRNASATITSLKVAGLLGCHADFRDSADCRALSFFVAAEFRERKK